MFEKFRVFLFLPYVPFYSFSSTFLFYLHILRNNDVFLPFKFGAGNWLVTGKIDLLAHALSSTAVLCDIVKLHYVA